MSLPRQRLPTTFSHFPAALQLLTITQFRNFGAWGARQSVGHLLNLPTTCRSCGDCRRCCAGSQDATELCSGEAWGCGTETMLLTTRLTNTLDGDSTSRSAHISTSIPEVLNEGSRLRSETNCNHLTKIISSHPLASSEPGYYRQPTGFPLYSPHMLFGVDCMLGPNDHTLHSAPPFSQRSASGAFNSTWGGQASAWVPERLAGGHLGDAQSFSPQDMYLQARGLISASGGTQGKLGMSNCSAHLLETGGGQFSPSSCRGHQPVDWPDKCGVSLPARWSTDSDRFSGSAGFHFRSLNGHTRPHLRRCSQPGISGLFQSPLQVKLHARGYCVPAVKPLDPNNQPSTPRYRSSSVPSKSRSQAKFKPETVTSPKFDVTLLYRQLPSGFTYMRLQNAKSLAEVEQATVEVEKQAGRLEGSHLAAIMTAVSKQLKRPRPQFLEYLADHILRGAPTLQPTDIATILFHAGKLLYRNDPLTECLAAAATQPGRLALFKPRDLASMMYAAGQLQYNNPAFLDQLATELLARADQLQPMDLGYVAHGLALLGYSHVELVTIAVGGILGQDSLKLKSQDLWTALLCLQKTGLRDQEMLGRACKELKAKSRLLDFEVHGLTMALNALAELQWRDEKAIDALSERLLVKLDEIKPKRLAQILLNTAKLQYGSRQLVLAAQGKLGALLSQLPAWTIFQLWDKSPRLENLSGTFIQDLADVTRQEVKQVSISGINIITVLLACKRLRYKDRQLFKVLGMQLTRRLEGMDTKKLGLVQGLVRDLDFDESVQNAVANEIEDKVLNRQAVEDFGGVHKRVQGGQS